MNPKLQKINDEIAKLRQKVTGYQTRLRELERQKTELENADIIALVRGVDIPPDDFADFVRAFKERHGRALPDMDGLPEKIGAETPDIDETKEDTKIEN